MINGLTADHHSLKPSATPLTTFARCLWVLVWCGALVACSGMPPSPQGESTLSPAPLQHLPLHFSAKDTSQWDKVVLFDESFAFREHRARWLYTAVTRAAKALTVVI